MYKKNFLKKYYTYMYNIYYSYMYFKKVGITRHCFGINESEIYIGYFRRRGISNFFFNVNQFQEDIIE